MTNELPRTRLSVEPHDLNGRDRAGSQTVCSFKVRRLHAAKDAIKANVSTHDVRRHARSKRDEDTLLSIATWTRGWKPSKLGAPS